MTTSSSPTTSSPAPGRRSRVGAIALLAALAACSALLLWVAPPGSGGASSEAPRVEASGAALAPDPAPGSARVELVSSGDEAQPVEGLRYRFDAGQGDAVRRYTLVLEQRMTVSEAEARSEVVTRLEALIELEASRDEPDVGYATVVEFDVTVEADGESIALPAVNSLLRGILVKFDLDARQGLGEDEPIAAANPQVKRMISLLVDVLRQAHPALPPEERVGVGARWTASSSWRSDQGSQLSASVAERHTLVGAAQDGEGLAIASELELLLEGASVAGSGEGRVSSRFDQQAGRLLESRGELSYTQRIETTDANTAVQQTRTLSWTVRAVE